MRHASRGRDTYSIRLRGTRKLGRPRANEGTWTGFDELCRKFSERLGYIDPERARDIIFEFERLLIQELVEKKIVRLYGFADFYLLHTPLKKVCGVARDAIKGRTDRFVREDIYEVRFKPHAKLRDYFRLISDHIDKKFL